MRSRRSLLDALEALSNHRDGVILIGAHAVYAYTSEADVPIATRTKDSDLALDPALLGTDPLLEEAMADADFHRNLESGQPGEWLSANGVPVDLLVPSSLVGDPEIVAASVAALVANLRKGITLVTDLGSTV